MCEVSIVRARTRRVQQYRENFVSNDFIPAGLEVVLEGFIGHAEGRAFSLLFSSLDLLILMSFQMYRKVAFYLKNN